MCEGTTVTWNVCQLLLCLLYINLKPAKTADWSISALQHQLARGSIFWWRASSVSPGCARLRCRWFSRAFSRYVSNSGSSRSSAPDRFSAVILWCWDLLCGRGLPWCLKDLHLWPWSWCLSHRKPTDASKPRHPVTFAQFHISYMLWKSVNLGLRQTDSSYHPVCRLFHPSSYHCLASLVLRGSRDQHSVVSVAQGDSDLGWWARQRGPFPDLVFVWQQRERVKVDARE